MLNNLPYLPELESVDNRILLHTLRDQDVMVDQVCFAIGDTACISIPGELFCKAVTRDMNDMTEEHGL